MYLWKDHSVEREEEKKEKLGWLNAYLNRKGKQCASAAVGFANLGRIEMIKWSQTNVFSDLELHRFIINPFDFCFNFLSHFSFSVISNAIPTIGIIIISLCASILKTGLKSLLQSKLWFSHIKWYLWFLLSVLCNDFYSDQRTWTTKSQYSCHAFMQFN